MIISEKNYQIYKSICLRLIKFHEMENKSTEVIKAVNICEGTKSMLDKLNPSYKKRFKNDNY